MKRLLPLALVAGLSVPAAVQAHTVRGCKKQPCKRHVVKPFSRYFDRVAWCESTGRWRINTGNGFYGGLQFTPSSWRAVGGRGLPHWHGRTEQKYRGVLLLRLQGRGAWPHCG